MIRVENAYLHLAELKQLWLTVRDDRKYDYLLYACYNETAEYMFDTDGSTYKQESFVIRDETQIHAYIRFAFNRTERMVTNIEAINFTNTYHRLLIRTILQKLSDYVACGFRKIEYSCLAINKKSLKLCQRLMQLTEGTQCARYNHIAVRNVDMNKLETVMYFDIYFENQYKVDRFIKLCSNICHTA
jgi:hypothetical protein